MIETQRIAFIIFVFVVVNIISFMFIHQYYSGYYNDLIINMKQQIKQSCLGFGSKNLACASDFIYEGYIVNPDRMFLLLIDDHKQGLIQGFNVYVEEETFNFDIIHEISQIFSMDSKTAHGLNFVDYISYAKMLYHYHKDSLTYKDAYINYYNNRNFIKSFATTG